MSFQNIAKKLEKSVVAIGIHGKRVLRLGPTKDAQGRINANQLANICKIDRHVITDNWITKRGLKATKKITKNEFKFWLINSNDFWKWAEKNKDAINFSKIERDELVPEPPWVELERKRDYKEIPKKQFKLWTSEEDRQLINLIRSGKTYKQIATIMDRTSFSCEHRYSRLVKRQKAKLKKIQLPWTNTENNMMLDMEKQGLRDEEIAYKLGREPDHIRDHRRNLRDKGLYKGYKY